MFTTPEPPPNPPPRHFPLRPSPLRQHGRGFAARQSRFQLPPTPRSRSRFDGCGLCACARLEGGGASYGPRRGLKRPEPRGAGEELGPGPEPPLSSQRVLAQVPARLSHVRAKNPLQSASRRGAAPLGQPSGSSAGFSRASPPLRARRCEDPAVAAGLCAPRGPTPGPACGLRANKRGARHPTPHPLCVQKMNGTQSLWLALLWPSELTIVWARIDPRSGLGSG